MITHDPLYGSQRAGLSHWALASGDDSQRRMTRGRCGPLTLYRMTLSFITPRRFNPAHKDNTMIHDQKNTLMFLATINAGLLASQLAFTPTAVAQQYKPSDAEATSMHVLYKTVKVGELDIFYREAGPKRAAPTVLLLHGFPTSSQMFRSLIPALADRYHVIAPDYPGYGNSSAPAHDKFEYSFDNLASVVEQFLGKIGVERYALYLMDYGAPIGYRIAAKHPERITALIVQNGNAYDEGLDNDFWKPIKAYWAEKSPANRDALRGLLTRDATIWQYTHGVRNKESISPDNWNVDQPLLDRPGNNEIQLDLFLSYGSNPPLYPQWQDYFRKQQPPTLVAWGKNDQIFPAAGAEPYKRDLKNLEFHLLDTGHFALEEDGTRIAALIRDFLDRKVKQVRH